HQFVIFTLKRDPCCHCLTLLNPCPDQGSFTKASRCRYQGKWYVHPSIKLAVQVWPWHNSHVRDRRNGQFRCKQEVITITTFHRQTPFFASTSLLYDASVVARPNYVYYVGASQKRALALKYKKRV